MITFTFYLQAKYEARPRESWLGLSWLELRDCVCDSRSSLPVNGRLVCPVYPVPKWITFTNTGTVNKFSFQYSYTHIQQIVYSVDYNSYKYNVINKYLRSILIESPRRGSNSRFALKASTSRLKLLSIKFDDVKSKYLTRKVVNYI